MPDPVIANKDGLIIGGHQRYTDLKEAGYEGTVPVVRIKRAMAESEIAAIYEATH